MKKILFVIHSLKNKGGSERVVTELSNSLCNYYKIEILCQKNEYMSYKIDDRVKITQIDKVSYKLLFAFKKHIEKNNYDFIVIHSMTKLTLSLLLIGLRHKNLFSLEHISYFNTKSKIQLFLKKLLYKHIKSVIVLTNNDKYYYEKFHDNVKIIRNQSPFEIESNNEIILNNKIISIGTLISRKGFERLIRAWSFVEPFSNEYILEIYGEGEDRLNLENLIKELKLKKVFLRGQVDDMPSVYRRASFFVMSSYYEGLPMVLIESQSFGLPIVSFDCPFGPSEIITNNHDGFLVENGNIELLADKIKYLIKNKNIIEKFSINSLESAKRFTEDKIITQWKDLIENAK